MIHGPVRPVQRGDHFRAQMTGNPSTPPPPRPPTRPSVWTRHRAVKHGESGGSVGTTFEGKGRGSREVRIGQAGIGRAQGVRGGGAPLPTEGKGSREGRR